MSVPIYFSALAKILIKARYVNPQQMEEAIALFLQWSESVQQQSTAKGSRRTTQSPHQRAAILIEILESLTESQIPPHLRCQVTHFFLPLPPFAKKLIQSGYVNLEQMRTALRESRKSGRPLTNVIESITGRQLPPDLLRQYKKQQLFELKILYGVESLDPERSEISNQKIKELIERLISSDICSRYRVLPLSQTETQPSSLLVAMVDPDNLDAQDDLNRILRPQGIKLRRMVITQEDYQHLLNQYRDQKLAQEKKEEAAKQTDISRDLDDLDTVSDAPEETETDLSEPLNESGGDPVINLVNRILAKALQDGVSHIHIEPQQEYLRVRFRKDGVLHQAFNPLPKTIKNAISARFKIMAYLDITERRIPQQGRIRRMFQGRFVDFRVSILPSRYGERIVLNIVDDSSTKIGLDILITDTDTLKIVRDMKSCPFGLILVTGPTTSGKTTTSFSLLAEQNQPDMNILTIEDPIQYSLPGITQVQVQHNFNLDVVSNLESIISQDADVILVGKIQDKKTAIMATKAVMQGHLIITELYTKDTVSAIMNLKELGVNPWILSEALLGVIAQRLLRRVCSDCRIPYQPNSSELERFGLSALSQEQCTFYKANTLQPEEIIEARVKGTLCPKCHGIGYKGRVGVYEVLRNSEQIQRLIRENAPEHSIKDVAIQQGMKTLYNYSLNLVKQGVTTFDEVKRVTWNDAVLADEINCRDKTDSLGRLNRRSLDSWQKLEQLEQQLENLTRQYQQLKQELEQSEKYQ
ncbi:MAG: ATPase, T2SS/T4P/T4SS family [Coleofasciculus sp. B1-GNL1-01]|uniref:GspE/PulE family protein n=1 Tax=Coleofasciculus sp. B1-GNL1-01 TaxID=3068484 RepID=UPI003302EAE9